MHVKVSSGKCRPPFYGVGVLIVVMFSFFMAVCDTLTDNIQLRLAHTGVDQVCLSATEAIMKVMGNILTHYKETQPKLQSWCHGYWWPGEAKRQGISSRVLINSACNIPVPAQQTWVVYTF